MVNLWCNMRTYRKYDDLYMTERIFLAMANLERSLSAIIDGSEEISQEDLLCGLQLVLGHAQSVLREVTAAEGVSSSTGTGHKLPWILSTMAGERDPENRMLVATIEP